MSDMMNLCFDSFFVYLLLAHVYLGNEWQITTPIHFSTISNMVISVNSSNSTLVIFIAVIHANPGSG